MSQDFLDAFSQNMRRGIGQRVKIAREELGLSQQELADIIDRRQAYISEIETGKVEPSPTTLWMLGRALDKPFLYFIPPDYRREDQEHTYSVEEAELIARIRYLQTSPQGFNYHQALHVVKSLISYDEETLDDMIDQMTQE